ncbi:hypothetical protein EDB81DRAFT_921475 [Dactylonectria macrodidyma]|uniref:Uncharacterized protein n=1 Tax=Dactylonectria macrodidyma TaxID=307937 RepID=A0A9P9D6N5_9HYPO|nr:hypothetical protein EDB81DRAFT_921475 [Dactylonectria macrodidyma]
MADIPEVDMNGQTLGGGGGSGVLPKIENDSNPNPNGAPRPPSTFPVVAPAPPAPPPPPPPPAPAARVDPDLLIPSNSMPDGSSFVTVACTRKDGTYINQYGVPGAHWYRLQEFHDPQWEWHESKEVSNCHNRILSKKNPAGKAGWVRDQYAGIFGVVFEQDSDVEENELDSICPEIVRLLDPNPGFPTTYVLIGWRLDPKDPENVTKCWEIRTDVRSLIKKNADRKIYQAACEAKRRYLAKEQREMTPDLLISPAELQQMRDEFKRGASVQRESRSNTPVQQDINTNPPSSTAALVSSRQNSLSPGAGLSLSDDMIQLLPQIVAEVVNLLLAKQGSGPALAPSHLRGRSVLVR